MSKKDRPTYDPCKQQPETMGELGQWLLRMEAHRFPNPFPVDLAKPPIPAFARLTVYCFATYGTPVNSYSRWRQLLGTYALLRSISTVEAEAASLQEVADALATDDKLYIKAGTGGSRIKPLAKKATINMQMMQHMQDEPDAMGWTCTQWQRFLRCRSRSTITETHTWKNLEAYRLKAKAERMKDKRRRPKHYSKAKD